MNQNILILLIALVTANLLLIAMAIVRSVIRRRRARFEGPPIDDDDEFGEAVGGVRLVGPEAEGRPALTRTDAVTGLLMPAEWTRIVADEDARIARYGHPATVVVIELEGLDRLVGALGREAGERILPAVADALGRNARGADHLARLGPSRFGVMLPETGEVEAVNYIERVREACDLWLESGAIALRLSIGWASSTADRSLGDAIALAQDRMYAELRRNTRQALDIELEGPPPLHDISPSPA